MTSKFWGDCERANQIKEAKKRKIYNNLGGNRVNNKVQKEYFQKQWET